MTVFKIKEGYTVPISGEAKQEVKDLPHPPFVGICPNEIKGLKPKLAVRVDDEVKVGSPLFFDKKSPNILFLSPAAGRVTAINYGPRRVIEEIIIDTKDHYEYENFPKFASGKIGKIGRDELIENLMKGGIWPFIRRRPFNKIANPADKPKAIFVNCMDSAPLANDPNFSLDRKAGEFAAGIEALKVLCGKVYVSARSNDPNPMFQAPEGIEYNSFSGKHPAGLIGTQISRLNPINKGETVWYMTARDTVLMGSFLLTGTYPIERVVAVAGPGVIKPTYVRTQMGAKISDMVADNLTGGEMRFVSGDVLSGWTKSVDGFLGFYDDLISVLPEGREQHFMGWMMPGLNQPCYSNAYLSGFLSKRFKMNTNLNGGRRAIIQSGIFGRVVALDIHPEFLVKATLANDIDAMEQLGILECDPEDFALCTYLCPSKTEVGRIIAGGLEMMEREG